MSQFSKYPVYLCCILVFFFASSVIADTNTLLEDFSFGSYGDGDGQFYWPNSIAISQNGAIYITDFERNDVQAFTRNGTFITKWGGEESSDDGFEGYEFVWGVATAPDGSVYTTDYEKCQVQQFTGSGSFIRAFGTEGSGPGELYAPMGIAVNSTGYVYVANWGNNRVEIFTAEGLFHESWNITTEEHPDPLEPFSIAIGGDDTIYVGMFENEIYSFSPGKTLIQSWQLPFIEDSELNDITVDSDNNLYAIMISYITPGGLAAIYQCKNDGSIETIPATGDYAFWGVAVDEKNRIFCTDVAGSSVDRFLSGTKTPGLPVPYLVWSDPFTEGDVWDEGFGNFLTTDGGSIEAGKIWNGYWPDMLVVKRDTSGTIQWWNSYGGDDVDEGKAVIETRDGNYTAIGDTSSSEMTGFHGAEDYWVVMANATGTLLWERCFGGSEIDVGTDILETSDGNFILTGFSYSNDGNVSGNHGDSDIWVVKMDPNGEILWQKCYGGTGADLGYNVIATENNGFLLTGSTASEDGDVSGNHGDYDIWVVEINSEGQILWQKCYGGTGDEGGTAVIKTNSGGYLLTGYTDSDNGDISGNHGDYDMVGIEINVDGDILWQRCYGGSGFDEGSDVMTRDRIYTFVGYTESSDKDVTGYHGFGDAWIIQTDEKGNIRWNRCFGGSLYDSGSSGASRGDGTYLITGRTDSTDGDVSDPDVEKDLWTFLIDEMASDFSANVESGSAPLTVSFIGEISTAMKADSWDWYFGDGGISHEQNPVHQYTAPGTYTLRMDVDGPGFTESVEKPGYITVT